MQLLDQLPITCAGRLLPSKRSAPFTSSHTANGPAGFPSGSKSGGCCLPLGVSRPAVLHSSLQRPLRVVRPK